MSSNVHPYPTGSHITLFVLPELAVLRGSRTHNTGNNDAQPSLNLAAPTLSTTKLLSVDEVVLRAGVVARNVRRKHVALNVSLYQ